MRGDAVLELPGGRTVGYADHAPDLRDATVVLWCHGGPGSRLEPAPIAADAAAAGLRVVGIDRPGYGTSPPQPGRTIAGWVGDALAVADAVGAARFVTVGVSTGGAYALAAAALTDLADAEARATMSPLFAHAVWDAPDRDAAIAAAAEAHGPGGSRMAEMARSLPPADAALFQDPAWLGMLRDEAVPAMFTHGLEGYADDRLADRDGWQGFDVARLTCPVLVLHGTDDAIADPIHAHRTAALVPGARLRLLEGVGHFGILPAVVPAVLDVLGR
jgi:pimeloyl-ACP methyl ester carboxylesterase